VPGREARGDGVWKGEGGLGGETVAASSRLTFLR
jgi:hypothetical protein